MISNEVLKQYLGYAENFWIVARDESTRYRELKIKLKRFIPEYVALPDDFEGRSGWAARLGNLSSDEEDIIGKIEPIFASSIVYLSNVVDSLTEVVNEDKAQESLKELILILAFDYLAILNMAKRLDESLAKRKERIRLQYELTYKRPENKEKAAQIMRMLEEEEAEDAGILQDFNKFKGMRLRPDQLANALKSIEKPEQALALADSEQLPGLSEDRISSILKELKLPDTTLKTVVQGTVGVASSFGTAYYVAWTSGARGLMFLFVMIIVLAGITNFADLAASQSVRKAFKKAKLS